MTDAEIIEAMDALPFESNGWVAAQRLRRMRKHLDVATTGSELGRRVIVANLVREGGSMDKNATLDGCDEHTRERFNQMCRENMKKRLLADILADMAVCDMEGWDKTAYLSELCELINGIMKGDAAK